MYELAPLGVNVAFEPEQMVGELTLKDSDEFTVTFAIAIWEQPELVPVTAYVAEEAGLTNTLPVLAPVDHV